MKRQAGDNHWTRRAPELRQPWAKLEASQIDDLCSLFLGGASQSWLARRYKIGRTTVWRYLRSRGLLPAQANT